MGSLGWQELLIVLVILALVLGASRVADLGGALGKGIREFRREASTDEKDEEKGKEKEQTVARSSDEAPRKDG
ncbi:MAG: twin-arginine translocase TatA/TatE family subunit [Chloroflexi bacterium]|nr:twin-arginine translocase TatA/TatE family subunit [Chloroflexota bacterium]